MASETTPLVAGAAGGRTGPTAYFLDGAHRRKPSSASGGEESFATATGEEVDAMPRGGVAAEFDPRPVSSGRAAGGRGRGKMRHPSVGGGWLAYVSGAFAPPATAAGDAPDANTGEVGTLVIPRKVPLKVEPKVNLANERTFLAWLHVIVVLAAASATIVTYSKGEGLVDQLYGIVLLPVSVAFLFYALWQYMRRALLIKNREPGPFIDVAGPTTLTVILMASIIAQFCAKLNAVYEN